MADLPGPFPAKPPNLGWAPSDSLQESLKRFAAKAPFAQMGVALVDLSRNPRIGYAGWNDTRQIYVASLAKIGAMFAAFQLRQSVRAAAKPVSVPDSAKVFDAIAADWTPGVSSRTKGRPADFPRLARIFSISGSQGNWAIDFIDSQKNWEEITKIGDSLPKGLGFRDRMKLMIANSNNQAAASCIDEGMTPDGCSQPRRTLAPIRAKAACPPRAGAACSGRSAAYSILSAWGSPSTRDVSARSGACCQQSDIPSWN